MCHGHKRELTTKPIQNKGPSSKYAPTTQKPTHHKPNEIRHNYARMCRLPLIKKSLPGHAQGVGDTYSEGDRSTGPQLKFGGWYTPIASFSRGHRPSACRSRAVTMDLKVDALCSAQYSLACTGTARHLLWLICDMCAIARSLLTRSMRWISAAFTTLTRRRIRSVAVLCVISSGIQRRLRSQAADGARTMTRSTAIGTDQRRTARTGHRRPGRHLHP
jgi:hypothetical protein